MISTGDLATPARLCVTLLFMTQESLTEHKILFNGYNNNNTKEREAQKLLRRFCAVQWAHLPDRFRSGRIRF